MAYGPPGPNGTRRPVLLRGDPLDSSVMVDAHTDFDDLSWHDCHVWAIALRPGDPDEGDWTSDLALDIDFIAEWICGTDGGMQFRVAPATLVFHGVTDPKIDIDCGPAASQVAVHPFSIGDIERELVENQRVYLDRPYYRWTIRLNWPDGGEITFGALGFTQTLRAEPVVTATQCLSLRQRTRLAALGSA